MYGTTPQAYDRAITVFSPDGRLFQVEYAKEAVKRGATAISIVTDECVSIIAYKSAHSKLIVPDSLKKIFIVEDHIAITASGLIADARKLVDSARVIAQRHRISYNEPADPALIARETCDTMQVYTQYGGIRPFGVSLLVAGFAEGGPQLFEAEPSGAMTGYVADSIGSGKKEVDEYLEKNYKSSLGGDQVINLAISALKKSADVNAIPKNIEIAHGLCKDKKFKILSEKEVASYL